MSDNLSWYLRFALLFSLLSTPATYLAAAEPTSAQKQIPLAHMFIRALFQLYILFCVDIFHSYYVWQQIEIHES